MNKIIPISIIIITISFAAILLTPENSSMPSSENLYQYGFTFYDIEKIKISLSEQNRAIKSIKIKGYYVFKSIFNEKEIIKYIELIKKGDREIPQIKHISGKALSRVDMYLKWQDENKVHNEYKTIHISETQMKNYPDYINFDSNYNYNNK